MKARDVMALNVISVGPDLPVRAVANTLVANDISAVPVVDIGGRVVGIVSEGDLIRRTEIGTEKKRPRWLEIFAAADTLAGEFVKAEGIKAADIMSREIVQADPDTSLRDIANLMEMHRIKRVPIVLNGKLIGIVSRANLLQALVSAPPVAGAETRHPDDLELRDRILARIKAQSWSHISNINVIVRNGIADLWGLVTSDVEHEALRILAEGTPGVKSVKDHLVLRRYYSAT